MEEEEEGGGAFLTSVSLDEPALDYESATGPEPSQDGTKDKDEVTVFLEAQAKRRRELQGYVASVRDQGGASGAVKLDGGSGCAESASTDACMASCARSATSVAVAPFPSPASSMSFHASTA